ncbi:hypothetical protein Pmani_029935 [Petrolisthes manimaculis]|uniref:Methyltransferase type 11 domain-containing protein n=1 Tax=Petrolisthes manimaculis TaxID=1843537 RepID=A0AAE1TWH3_9EUCA|nr:hypothetical protein Pmani_029935 [Petrolisthes manimaculis]
MDLKGAQEAFLAVLQQIPQPETRKAFLTWIDETWIRAVTPTLMVCPPPCPPPPTTITTPTTTNICTSDYSSGDTKLRKIADDLREIMPLNAILPTEQITFPSVGENADCDPSHTLHVDAFLYDEDMVDELCDTGELARNYCVDCSSHNTQPITYISHSASRERLAYVFRALLPPIPEDTILLDIGSRLGAVLYGAYIYSKCRRIVGVELNPDLCQVQQTIINKYQFQDRIQVLNGDIQDQGEVVRAADIICLNNVFEFFIPAAVQARIWCFLRSNTKKGALLVTIPSLEDSLQYIDCGFQYHEWAREISPHNPNITAPFDFQSETSEVKLYQVI